MVRVHVDELYHVMESKLNAKIDEIYPLALSMQWLPDNWKPKVVAVDIDGTLTNEDKLIEPSVIDALQRLEQAGIPVILATGNVRAITYGLWRFLNLSGPICCENGGVLWHPDWGETKYRADGSEAKAAAQWLATKIEGLRWEGIETNQWRESEWCLSPNEDLDKITQLIENSQWSHLSVIRTGFAIHLMEPQLSKGSGLQIILKKMGLTPDDLLCVGDAPNDLSMFEISRWSVAVGGAFAYVTQAADVASPLPHGKTIEPLVNAILE